MHRIRKLLGMILILGITFFIICDEKGIKIEFKDGELIMNDVTKNTQKVQENLGEKSVVHKKLVYKNSDLIHIYIGFNDPNILRKSFGIDPNYKGKPLVYKNSDYIRIYSGFTNQKILRNSAGLDTEFLTKLEQEKINRKKNQKYTGPNIISLDNEGTISNIFQPIDVNQDNENLYTLTNNENSPEKAKNEEYSYTGNLSNDSSELDNTEKSDDRDIYSKIKIHTHKFYGLKAKRIDSSLPEVDNITRIEKVENDSVEDEKVVEIINFKLRKPDLYMKKGTEIIKPQIVVRKYELRKPTLSMRKGKEIKRPQIKIKQPKNTILLKKGVAIAHEFILDNNINDGEQQFENGFGNEIYDNLIADEEIDINTLESENDEFLKKVFEKTNDVNVMNLIIETYLNEYQFIKAKKFIESLSSIYTEQVDPLLNIRVAFNSFALTSKTTESSLISIIQNYQSNGKISEEDALRYSGIIALTYKKYDRFFEIAGDFTLDKHQAFASKVKGYKDQISKQMGMPEYYFDTLIALELFNHGFFQSAKLLALSSLQQNSDYILPYQVLAYANFLTNSRDTSAEYLKKLIELDPNNAEKYRFLMGVAYYRGEKYEQSVVMLSMIKNEKLRLDAQRYLINDYLFLNQKNKLISSRNKLLGYEDLVASDFYTYFYEAFYHPYSAGEEFQIYAFDTELANKMLRVCTLKLSDEEKVVCTYGTIGKNIAVGQFEGLENMLLNLVSEYPQGYLYHALGEYYIQQGDLEKAKIYLLKAVSLTQEKSEILQIKNLLQDTM